MIKCSTAQGTHLV